MPRIKLIRPDPLEADIRAEIASGMARMQINQRELARRAGIEPSTLCRRMKNVREMRLSELWAIRKVFERGGY